MDGFDKTEGGHDTLGPISESEVSEAGCFSENRPLPGSRSDHRAKDRARLRSARQGPDVDPN
ncbi:MAG: hypothetical protein CMJ23_11325 [Phycisphaerae bacterium]|nr:hypothetical protein [Phycisphaerae bacterium]